MKMLGRTVLTALALAGALASTLSEGRPQAGIRGPHHARSEPAREQYPFGGAGFYYQFAEGAASQVQQAAVPPALEWVGLPRSPQSVETVATGLIQGNAPERERGGNGSASAGTRAAAPAFGFGSTDSPLPLVALALMIFVARRRLQA